MGFYSRARLEAMSPDEQQQLVATHINLGYHPVTGDEFLVPTLDLHSGFTINGVQGSGKSALVQYIVYQLVQQGYAVAVADPHLDTIDDCIAQLPDWALQKTFVLDLTDVDWPFAANVLALGQLVTPEERTAAVDRIVHIFELLWPETGSQVGLPRYLRNAVLALLDTPNTTLVDMYDLLTDEVVRARIVARVTDPTVRTFWRRFSLLKPTRQDTLVGPLVARLEALFAGRPIVRNIVGQRANSVDWRKVIDERQIVLIKLPIKRLEQDSRLIAMVLLAQISAAIFSYGDTPPEQRAGLSLIIDEAPVFCTKDLAALFSQGRKFGIRMGLCWQMRSQFPDYLRDATMSATTKLVMRVTPEDARDYAPQFSGVGGGVEPTYKPVEWLLSYGHDGPMVEAFTDAYLRPLQQHRRGKQVVVQDASFGVNEIGLALLSGWTGQAAEVRIEDPIPYLNALLYEVMQKGTPDLVIPREIPRGFANAGDFFALVRNIAPRDPLRPGYAFPAAAHGKRGELLAFLACLT